jgi:hypothetical protein
MSEYCSDVAQTTDSGYIALTNRMDVDQEIWLLKLDSEGDSIWTKTYSGFIGMTMIPTADSCFLITGWVEPGTDFDIFLMKVNSLGDSLWTRTYGWAQFDVGFSITPAVDGGYVIAGIRDTDEDIFESDIGDFCMIKVDEEGNMRWSKSFGGTGFECAFSVITTFDGGYALAGYKSLIGLDSYDAYVVKTDSLGDVDWIKEISRKPERISISVSPNPFNSAVSISVDCHYRENGNPEIEIFDINGRMVFDNSVGANRDTPVVWQPDEKIGSGVYLVRAMVGDESVTKRVVYLK